MKVFNLIKKKNENLWCIHNYEGNAMGFSDVNAHTPGSCVSGATHSYNMHCFMSRVEGK